MKLTKIQKFSWIACPGLFGVVLLVTGIALRADEPHLKTLNLGLAFLLLTLYGTNSLLARLVEKGESD